MYIYIYIHTHIYIYIKRLQGFRIRFDNSIHAVELFKIVRVVFEYFTLLDISSLSTYIGVKYRIEEHFNTANFYERLKGFRIGLDNPVHAIQLFKIVRVDRRRCLDLVQRNVRSHVSGRTLHCICFSLQCRSLSLQRVHQGRGYICRLI